MSVGLIVLVGLTVAIFAGLADRVFDRLRLTDSQALLFIVAIAIGSFIDIPIASQPVRVSLNVGGGLLPIGLAIYLLVRAGTTKEWTRAIVATLVTGVVLLGLRYLMRGFGHGRADLIDPLYVIGIVGGLVGYLAGRSRRSAFIAATLGVLFTEAAYYFSAVSQGVQGTVSIGGAGGFDATVISGVLAVLLAEVIGETRERLGGGSDEDREYPPGLRVSNVIDQDNQSDAKDQTTRKEGE